MYNKNIQKKGKGMATAISSVIPMRNLLRINFVALILTLLIGLPVFAADDDWKSMPVITQVYELSKEEVYLQWDGEADLYYVNVDGKKVATVKINNAIIKVKPGVHNIVIVPIKLVSKDVDTKIELGVAKVANGSIDLGALGIDPKDILQGDQSETFKLNFSENSFYKAVPEIKDAYTDFDDNVLLTVSDKYDADIYYVAIKSGKDVINTVFDTSSKEAAALISKNKSTVTITLDQKYLEKNEWMVPELDQEYSFSVKLGKWPKNYVDGEQEKTSVIESKESKFFEYTPYAAWKNPPEITYASQTADGEITLKWEHDDNGLGCEYSITSPDKILVVKTGDTEIGKTKKKEFVVKDLMNGKHTFEVTPVYDDETEISSEKQTLKLENDWVVAPSFSCSLEKKKTVVLTWDSPKEIDNYHIIVSAGSGSLLRFVNLDFKKYKEFDVPAKAGKMEYSFTYDKDIDPENGTRLKFEMYGTRETEKDETQKSATSSQTITLK